MAINFLDVNFNAHIYFIRSEASNNDPSSVLLGQYRGSPTSVRSSTSLEDGEDLSIESIEGSSSLEADIVEIDFVLGSRGDMRLLSRAKKRRLRVNRQRGRHLSLIHI